MGDMQDLSVGSMLPVMANLESHFAAVRSVMIQSGSLQDVESLQVQILKKS